MVIKLIELIKLAGVELGDFKINCATRWIDCPTRWSSYPHKAFFDGCFKQWQEEGHTRNNFKCKQVLSLIHIRQDQWLFAGVYAVNGFAPKQEKYDTEKIGGLAHLTGRVIVRFKRPGRQAYIHGQKYGNDLIVEAIPEKRMTIGDFPGFN